MAAAAVKKLDVTLLHVFSVLPQIPSEKLKQLKFYLLWGEGSPDGGRESGMSYIRPGEPSHYPHLDPSWEMSS